METSTNGYNISSCIVFHQRKLSNTEAKLTFKAKDFYSF